MLAAKRKGDDAMFSSVSPYALLSACKPRPYQANTSRYDLYSIVQDQPQSPVIEELAEKKPAEAQTLPVSSASQIAASRKTHYVSDIKTKHSAALLRTSLKSGQISS